MTSSRGGPPTCSRPAVACASSTWACQGQVSVLMLQQASALAFVHSLTSEGVPTQLAHTADVFWCHPW